MHICFATQNRNKLAEIQAQMPEGIVLCTPFDLGCTEELPENQATLEGNANEKAQYLCLNYRHDCFADDTGLEVNALGGEPGVFSARYAGPQKNASDNMALLLRKLQGAPDRSARFRTVIALCLGGATYFFEGELKGRILESTIGEGGFGYDPIFVPDGEERSLAQMTMDEKNAISHRGIAFRKLVSFLRDR